MDLRQLFWITGIRIFKKFRIVECHSVCSSRNIEQLPVNHILINELTCFDRLFKKWSQTADPLIGHICIQILSILSGLCCVWIL